MKRYTILLLLAACSVVSCKKSSGLQEFKSTIGLPPIPNVPDVSFDPGNPYISNVWGTMMAITVRGMYIDGSATVPIYSNSASANFAKTHAGGKVSVNGYILDSIISHSFPYLAIATYVSDDAYAKDSISYLSDDNWSVSGNNSIPSFSYNYTGSFPSYTGTIPQTLIGNNGFTISFDASNTNGGDSAFIAVCNSTGYAYPATQYSNLVSTNGGVATLSGGVLSQYNSLNGGTTYIEVFVYKYTTRVFGNKQFAFVKMNEYIQNVTIN